MHRSAVVMAIVLVFAAVLSYPTGTSVTAQARRAGSSQAQSGRIQGTVYKYRGDLRTNLQSRDPVAGAEVGLEKEGIRMQVRTTNTGTFFFAGLPAGKYKVRCKAPDRLLTNEPSEREIEITQGGYWSLNFTISNNGGIRGRIDPFPGLRLDLVLAKPPFEDYPRALYSFPDNSGSYRFEKIAPGQYLLGIRLDRTSGFGLPFPRYYYPGVTDPMKAAVINLSEGQWIDLESMRLPPILAGRTVTGKVVYPDGSPAADAEVAFDLVEYPYQSSAGTTQAADDGRFSFNLFDGLKYSARAAGVGVAGAKPLRSDPVEIPRNGDVFDVTAMLSHPIESTNLLQNPDGSKGVLSWSRQGNALPEVTRPGACLAVRDGGVFSQEIILPRHSAGRSILAFGWVSSERINESGSITGLPYFELTLWPSSGRPDARYLEARMHGATLRSPQKPDEWVPAFAVGEVPPNAGRVYLLLKQAEQKGVPQNGSAARFFSLGVYLLDTELEARFLRDYLISKRP